MRTFLLRLRTSGTPDSIGGMATHGMFWSVIQNWGGRALNFALFVLLARFLTPTEFGIASAAAVIILMINQVAEFGFADAIIQRPNLEREDVNLPFYFSITLSTLLALLVILNSGMLERWLHSPGSQPVIVALAILAPVNTLSLFQEMQYKRHLAFHRLAFRVLIANLLAGVIAAGMAVTGWGVWALVAQSYIAIIFGLIWMWVQPYWLPSLTLRPSSFRSILRFSISILAMRVLDFGSTRLVEFVTIGRYGVKAYGLYSASSRLNQTLLDMLQAALSDVSLSVLSKISSERERLAAIYRVSVVIAANLLAPFFLLSAALSMEICDVLFGHKWDGIDVIARPLFLLGAVQVIQFLSRPYLSARGRSEKVLIISSFKFVLLVTGLLLVPHGSVYQLVIAYVLLQLLAAPVSFYITAHELGASLRQTVLDLLPVVAAGLLADRAVWFVRPLLIEAGMQTSFLRGLVLGLVFVLPYALVILVLGRSQIRMVIEFVRNRLKGKLAR